MAAPGGTAPASCSKSRLTPTSSQTGYFDAVLRTTKPDRAHGGLDFGGPPGSSSSGNSRQFLRTGRAFIIGHAGFETARSSLRRPIGVNRSAPIAYRRRNQPESPGFHLQTHGFSLAPGTDKAQRFHSASVCSASR